MAILLDVRQSYDHPDSARDPPVSEPDQRSLFSSGQQPLK